MTQVGLQDAWLKFLKDYVNPLQELVFTGYEDYVRFSNLGIRVLMRTHLAMVYTHSLNAQGLIRLYRFVASDRDLCM